MLALELIHIVKAIALKSSGIHIFSTGLFQTFPRKLQSFSTNPRYIKAFKNTEDSHYKSLPCRRGKNICPSLKINNRSISKTDWNLHIIYTREVIWEFCNKKMGIYGNFRF